MIDSRYINIIVVFTTIIAVIFTAVFMFAPQALGIKRDNSDPDYIETLFDDTKMNIINIEMDENGPDIPSKSLRPNCDLRLIQSEICVECL